MARLGVVTISLLLAVGAWAQPANQKDGKKGKPEPEEITQTLAVIPDPPSTIAVETSRLAFHVAPLSAKGLLSQQVEVGLKALEKLAKGGTLVKVRAFVSGAGDMRRVPAIISEIYTKKKKPLPVINVVRVGLLPLNGAQVSLEAVSEQKKAVNPNGLIFISGQQAREAADPNQPKLLLEPMAARSVEMLKSALAAHALAPADVLRITCMDSSLDDADAVRRDLLTAFPAAPLNIVQIQRIASDRMVECEAVARLKAKPAQAIVIDNPTNAVFARAALAGPGKILFTAMQMAFGPEDSDIRLAFTRLGNTLNAAGSSYGRVFYLTAYPSNAALLARFRALRFEFLDRAKAPASTNLPFEGMPSLDATVGMEAIATVGN